MVGIDEVGEVRVGADLLEAEHAGAGVARAVVAAKAVLVEERLAFFHLRMHVGPVLSGIRVMQREVFDCVPSQYRQRFQIETALNYFCARAGFRQINTVVRNLGHIIKESKRGILSGLSSRWDMSSEVFLVQCDLYLFQGWRWVPTEESPVAEYDLFEAELFD